ncbi:MAG: apolipoprotein N-acyltransferase [Myxococcales bacterium]|nr:apolipoprotein N-acyltransferase [Myxococcales bacterium]MCB9531116.1 apolipoprotein N-acyltransferase [Myxococcales bacterium]MCB9533026.1 apolipoprotein N-acyltransferase [Myxococcales bacterium]
MSKRTSLRSAALAVLTGVLVFLSFPPWGLWWLAFVAVAPLALACEGTSARRAAALGLIAGTVANLGGFYWIALMLRVYGFMPWVAALALYLALAVQQGAIWAFGAATARALIARGAPPAAAWGAGLGVAELLWPTIFPWDLGASQYTNLWAAQLAELGGVTALTVLLGAMGAGVATAIASRRPTHCLIVATIATVAAHGYGAVRVRQVDSDMAAAATLRVGMVQANIGVDEKGGHDTRDANLERHRALSAQLAGNGVELVVWPETAFEASRYFAARGTFASAADALAAAESEAILPRDTAWLPHEGGSRGETELAPQRGFAVPLLTGVVMVSRLTSEQAAAIPSRAGRPRRVVGHNAAILLDRDGRVLGSYDKSLLMPFTETLPGAEWLFEHTGISLYDWIPDAGAFFVGHPTEGLDLPHDGDSVRLGILVCYEDIMAGFGRAIHAGRPEVLVNLTNDAWFLDTAEPELHLALATFRTIEQRVPLVRSTNTGISAFVDAAGRIVSRTPTYEEATLVWDVPRMPAASTPFMRFGPWLTWLALAIAFVPLAARRLRGPAVSTGGQR